MHNSHDVHAAGFASYYPGINYPPCSPSSQSEEGITGMPLLPQGHLVYKIGCEGGGEHRCGGAVRLAHNLYGIIEHCSHCSQGVVPNIDIKSEKILDNFRSELSLF